MTDSRTPLPTLFGREVRAIHCAGIGGMGLGPLAIHLARLGYAVTGEDDAMTAPMRAQLERAGVEVNADFGFRNAEFQTTQTAGAPLASDIPHSPDLLVVSTAISPEHPAAVAAKTRDIPIVRRGELLAEVVRGKKLAAICGSHGKTTTTAMLVTALHRAGFSAGYILGGLFNDTSLPPADTGDTDWVVAEIDESDGTIENFSPEITIVTNLDWDHPDHYRTPADIEAAFQALFARTKRAVIGSIPNSALRTSHFHHTFGSAADAGFRYQITRAANDGQTLALAGKFPISSATVRALGDFNAANAAAALAAAHLMGATLAPDLLAAYPGVRRRQSILRATDTLTVVEDYAHHPAEIRALLSSLHSRIPAPGRLLVAFQPHRYSRTAQFKADFAAALAIADRSYLIDVYPAGEAPIAGGDTADLHTELRAAAPAQPVIYRNGKTDATLATLARDVRPGDWVVFVGAGDIDHSARAWLTLATEYEKAANHWGTLGVALRGTLSPASKVRIEEPLAQKTTMRAGGAARLYAEPADERDLALLIDFARARAIRTLLLGRGSNLIIPDEGVDALVISLAAPNWQHFEILPGNLVSCGAGLRLKNLCGLAAAAGLAGFEFLEGIPGNLGGALRMNAGAMGDETFNRVETVRVMTHTGEIKTLRPDEMGVTYRRCGALAANNLVALDATLRPAGKKSPAEITAQIEANRAKRQTAQPREPSAGSIFKNPPNDSAGRLIDTAGLKGARIGGAEVSPRHANFIINRGGATATDIIQLIRRIRSAVLKTHGITLDPEVLLFGANWEDYL
ncbi:UDP-N-acetylmuramate--alanine ligase [Ereboglobus sp. PH5-5]|uniref:UDP-N-acetylmuramate dehydrogenase n=1 Tax=Ereboglobus sp. PH5-5 TaxID=2940529 RepID=UPI002405BCF2|nr:UDP-N-acetylmuramate dehydrogenase [Ereboglobus sp. PH5-5]MDF9833237.1 UDP-N-acetylmuramate--alanine ligase [Ereboglobus sp. PH5-5]